MFIFEIFYFIFLIDDNKFESDENDMKDFKFVRYLTKEKVINLK
jgi:hypothetical protein